MSLTQGTNLKTTKWLVTEMGRMGRVDLRTKGLRGSNSAKKPKKISRK